MSHYRTLGGLITLGESLPWSAIRGTPFLPNAVLATGEQESVFKWVILETRTETDSGYQDVITAVGVEPRRTDSVSWRLPVVVEELDLIWGFIWDRRPSGEFTLASDERRGEARRWIVRSPGAGPELVCEEASFVWPDGSKVEL